MRKPFTPAGRRSSRSLMHPHSPSSPSTPDSGGSVRRLLAPILLLAAVALPSAVLYHAAAPATTSPFRARPWNFTASAVAAVADNVAADLADQEPEEVRLKRVLNAAAKEDKTVILTTLNAAWAHPNSVVDLFIQSFRIGNGTRRLLDHLVIIALDQKAYVRCISLHEHCFALTTKGVDFSGEKRFMSNDYLEMMWRRIDLLRLVLEMGYNFIFTIERKNRLMNWRRIYGSILQILTLSKEGGLVNGKFAPL